MTRHKHFNLALTLLLLAGAVQAATSEAASSAEKLGFLDAISRTAEIMGVSESGFRLVNNTGLDGGQTVGHMRIFGVRVKTSAATYFYTDPNYHNFLLERFNIMTFPRERFRS